MEKTIVIMFTVLMLLGIQNVQAEAKSYKFKVAGNYGMCEKRIEKAALAVPGVRIHQCRL
jgi:hypothetical protein